MGIDHTAVGRLVLSVVTVGGIAAAVLLQVVPPRQSANPSNDGSTYKDGVDTVAILFVSSRCAYSDVKPAITMVRGSLTTLRSGPRRLVHVGISLDTDVETGFEFLLQFGNFNEISVGGSVTNLAALRYIWQDSIPIASIPQLVIVERTSMSSDGKLSVITENVVGRLVGMNAIAAWYDEQARLIPREGEQ